MKLIDINKIYHNKLEDVQVFENLNADFPQSGFILISGDSGMGKSTLFNIIAGIDKDYQGTVESNEKIEYLNQQIILYENLTVNENLNIVDDNQTLIDDMLEKFDLMSLKNHKVKKLSNGEKRRVQIIRSLMTQPEILLCDEPSASLDYDNALLVLKLLRTVSETTTVLVTTHDQELFLPYIDSLYEIKDKKLICTKKHEDILVICKETQEVSRNFSRYIQVCLMNMKAHLSTNIITVFLLTCMIISMYSCFYYTNKSNEELAKQKWYYSSNLIQNVPKYKMQGTPEKGYIFLEFDIFHFEQLQEVLRKYDSIVGYTLQRDYWDYDPRYQSNSEYTKGLQSYLYDNLLDEPYTVYSGPKTTFAVLSELDNSRNNIFNHEAHAFMYNILRQEDLLIQIGQFPTSKNEVVLGKELAKKYQDKFALKDLNQLIGKTIDLDMENNAIDLLNVRGKVSISVKVVGISSFENYFENRIYFGNNGFFELLAEEYQYDKDEVCYYVMKFLVDPMSNCDGLLKDLNDKEWIRNDTFEVFSDKDSVYEQNFQMIMINSTMVVIASLILILISFAGLIVNKLYFKKQYIKENMILKQYHYENMKVECLSNIMIAVFATVVSLAVIPLLIMLLNVLSQMIANYDLLTLNIKHLMMCSFVVDVIYLLLMTFISRIVLKKYACRKKYLEIVG